MWAGYDDGPFSVIPIRLSPWKYAAIALVAYAINDFIALSVLYSTRVGHSRLVDQLFVLSPQTGGRHPLLVVFHIAEAFLFLPTLLAFYAWLDSAPRLLLKNLAKAEVFEGKSDQTPGDLREYSEYRFSKNVWSLLYVSGIILALWGARSQWFQPSGWDAASQAFAQTLVPMDFVLWLSLWIIFCMIVEAIIVFYKVFDQQQLRLRPFHPDHVCGLGPMKHYAQHLVYFLAAVGFYLIIDTEQAFLTKTFQNDSILHVYLVLYPILVPLCFLWSLWPCHAAMVRERDRILLSTIAVSFSEPRRASVSPAIGSAAMKMQLDDVEIRQKLHDIIMKFPIWPFDSGNTGRVAAVAFSPPLTELLRFLLLPHS